jgi:hypothetical protein
MCDTGRPFFLGAPALHDHRRKQQGGARHRDQAERNAAGAAHPAHVTAGDGVRDRGREAAQAAARDGPDRASAVSQAGRGPGGYSAPGRESNGTTSARVSAMNARICVIGRPPLGQRR